MKVVRIERRGEGRRLDHDVDVCSFSAVSDADGETRARSDDVVDLIRPRVDDLVAARMHKI